MSRSDLGLIGLMVDASQEYSRIITTVPQMTSAAKTIAQWLDEKGWAGAADEIREELDWFLDNCIPMAGPEESEA